MKKVLLINDDKDFQHLMRTYLERKGFEAKTIDANEAIIPLVKDFEPHVIIIDMEAETDNEICNEIRQKAKTQAKIVLLTDKSVKATVMHACKPDIVIQKPFNPEDLIENIAQ
jgi:DNA-binding response OmpR family regulator